MWPRGERRAGESGHHWRPAVYLDAAMRRTAPAVGAVDGAYVEVPHAVGDAAVGPCRQRAVHRGVAGVVSPSGRAAAEPGHEAGSARRRPGRAGPRAHTHGLGGVQQAGKCWRWTAPGRPTRTRRVTRGLHSPAPLRALTWKYHSPPARLAGTRRARAVDRVVRLTAHGLVHGPRVPDPGGPCVRLPGERRSAQCRTRRRGRDARTNDEIVDGRRRRVDPHLPVHRRTPDASEPACAHVEVVEAVGLALEVQSRIGGVHRRVGNGARRCVERPRIAVRGRRSGGQPSEVHAPGRVPQGRVGMRGGGGPDDGRRAVGPPGSAAWRPRSSGLRDRGRGGGSTARRTRRRCTSRTSPCPPARRRAQRTTRCRAHRRSRRCRWRRWPSTRRKDRRRPPDRPETGGWETSGW